MSQYNKIKFSEYWDKLKDPEFTTIRSWNKDKETYYRSKIGEKFTVLKVERWFQNKNGNLICHAWLKGVEVLDPRNLPNSILEKDVSLEGEIRHDWLVSLLKKEKALLLTFSKSPVPYQKKLEVQ